MTGTAALVLPVVDDLYALPIDRVGEVVTSPNVTRLPTAPAVVLGLFNLRGQIVALLDTAALMGIGSINVAEFATVVTCEHGAVALASTGIPQRVVLDDAVAPSEAPSTAGLFRVDGQLATLLDPSALLTPQRLGGHDGRNDLGTIWET